MENINVTQNNSLTDIVLPTLIRLTPPHVTGAEGLLSLLADSSTSVTIGGTWQEFRFPEPTFIGHVLFSAMAESAPDLKVEVKTIKSLSWESVDLTSEEGLISTFNLGVTSIAVRFKSRGWKRRQSISSVTIMGFAPEKMAEIDLKLGQIESIKKNALDKVAEADARLKTLQQLSQSEEAIHQQKLADLNKSILESTKVRDDLTLGIQTLKTEFDSAQANLDRVSDAVAEQKQSLELIRAEHVNLKEQAEEKSREKQRLEMQISDLQDQVREELKNKSLIVSTLDGFQKKCSKDLIFYYVLSGTCFLLGLILFNKITDAVLSLGDLSKYKDFWEIAAATSIRVPTASIFLAGLATLAGTLTWALRSISNIQREQRKFARVMPVVVEIAEDVTSDLKLSPQEAAIAIAKIKIHFIKDTVLEIGREEGERERESMGLLSTITNIRNVLPSNQKRLSEGNDKSSLLPGH